MQKLIQTYVYSLHAFKIKLQNKRSGNINVVTRIRGTKQYNTVKANVPFIICVDSPTRFCLGLLLSHPPKQLALSKISTL